MKAFLLSLVAVSAFVFTSKAQACAMCVDLYPETVKLSKSVSVKLVNQLKLKKDVPFELGGTTLSCTKRSIYIADGVTECSIIGGDDGKTAIFRVKGKVAGEMLKSLAKLKGEIDPAGESGDESPPPTGKKVSIGSRVISGEEYTFSLSPSGANLRCSNAQTCSLNILSITMQDLPLEP